MPTDSMGVTFANAAYVIEGWDLQIGRVTEGVTYWIATLEVKCYTDIEKNFTIEENVVLGSMRQDFVEADNTEAKHYAWLMTLEQFDGATLITD